MALKCGNTCSAGSCSAASADDVASIVVTQQPRAASAFTTMQGLRTAAAAILLLDIVLQSGGTAAASLRGVDPAKAAFYTDAQARGSFTCFDGLKTVPAAALNDNYCDCPDGSDEPGSSACIGGTFYCRNRGHQPRVLYASFADDGICGDFCYAWRFASEAARRLFAEHAGRARPCSRIPAAAIQTVQPAMTTPI